MAYCSFDGFLALEVRPLAGVSSAAVGFWLGGMGLILARRWDLLVVRGWLPSKWRNFDFENWWLPERAGPANARRE